MKREVVTVRNANGRLIHGHLIGSPERNRVLVYHHGFPASGLEAMLAAKIAADLGITVLALDRPGLGSSEWYPDRKLEEWPGDVLLAADHLGIEKFSVLAVSGGTPGAVAVASKAPDRVHSLTIISGLGPVLIPGALHGMNWVNRRIIQLAQRRPRFSRTLLHCIASSWRTTPIVATLWFATLLPRYDLGIVRRQSVASILSGTLRDAMRNGVAGVVSDFETLVSDWEGMLRDVRAPTHIWHGDCDTYVPMGMAHMMHERIKGSTIRIVPGGGHFMIVDLLPEILGGLIWE